MDRNWGNSRLHPAWWTAMLIAVIAAACGFTAVMFAGIFRSTVPVTLTADRSGLVMESGAQVRMRGIEVGRVTQIIKGDSVNLRLDLSPDQIQHIPANVDARIRAGTVFGGKYVDLVYPDDPSIERLSAGAVLRSQNEPTEVNTVFESLVGVLEQIDPPKLNATLSAVADAVRGKGPMMGQATSDAAQVVSVLYERTDSINAGFRAMKGFSDAYGTAARDIIAILAASSATSSTVTAHAASLDALLLNAIGFAQAGTELLVPTRENFIKSINMLLPTTDLLFKYNPVYTCTLLGAQWLNEHSESVGGNGYSTVVDMGLSLAVDLYRYPDNLPVVAAKGGPGGKPSCGSLPDASKRYPVRRLVTNTGWGTGVENRPNPGIAHPWWVNFLPVTRAVPEPPILRGAGPPAIGPVPYPGAPPYGAPLFGPDGSPLWAPPPPGAPPPPVPGIISPPPPYGPGQTGGPGE